MVGKIAHLVLKMGKENYMFGLTVGTLRAALWLGPVGTSGEGKLHVLVRK